MLFQIKSVESSSYTTATAIEMLTGLFWNGAYKLLERDFADVLRRRTFDDGAKRVGCFSRCLKSDFLADDVSANS